MKILVEQRDGDERCGPTLAALAGAFQQLGHAVRRWSNRDPLLDLAGLGLAVLWNGIHPLYAGPVRRLKATGMRMLFVELGWLPQDGTFQIDHAGINGLASWAGEPLEFAEGPSVPVRAGKPLLVCCQTEGDMQIEKPQLNTMFRGGMADFLAHLAANAEIEMIIRPHPLAGLSKAARKVVEGCPRMRLDGSGTLAEALSGCCGLATINSSAGVEGLAAGLPLIAYGRAVWAVKDAAYMPATTAETRAVIGELAAGKCSLSQPAQAAALARIRWNQWQVSDLPNRLKSLMAGDPWSAN